MSAHASCLMPAVTDSLTFSSQVARRDAADRIGVRYRVNAEGTEAAALARRIVYEQTVELPPEGFLDPAIESRIVGEVHGVEPDPGNPGHSLVRVSYDADLADGQLSQLLNLLYGNISILPHIRLLEATLPDSLLAHFGGPRFGIEGLRALTGVFGRPLLATAIKPRGAPVAALAALAGAFARAGGDVVKDDQNLVDGDTEAFKHRVGACADAVRRANAAGGHCLYFPHVAGPPSALETRLDFVRHLGLRGVLMCPMIAGLDAARELTARRGLVLMAHPALTGSYTNPGTCGIDHGVLLGTLFRLAGADISVFPNHGGRFGYSRAQCLDVRDRLTAPLGDLRPALPCPAGGMRFDSLPAMAADYGAHAMYLIGGALLGHGDDLELSTRQYLDGIRAHFDERLEAPREPDDGIGEPVPRQSALENLSRVFAQHGYAWAERPARDYKDSPELPFRGVQRVELVGRDGERTAFELRYFEVAPGGYSSLEKHLHAHAIIGARGAGRLVLGNEEIAVRTLDVAYIAPLQVHQLRNTEQEPFGFFCIVDRHRDRPMPP